MSLLFTVEWVTHLDVCTLQPDPLSEHVAAFSYHSEQTDRKYLQEEEGQCQFDLFKKKTILCKSNANIQRLAAQQCNVQRFLSLVLYVAYLSFIPQAVFNLFSAICAVFVFKPSELRTLFTHKSVCSKKVHRAVFVPREEPLARCDEGSQWLNRSQLYFLTQDMVEIIHISDFFLLFYESCC